MEGGAATVFASGFFSGDAPAFGVWVALADGTTFPLEIVSATNDLSASLNEFSIYPNPITDEAFVQIDLKESMVVRVDIVDISGRIIQESLWDN